MFLYKGVTESAASSEDLQLNLVEEATITPNFKNIFNQPDNFKYIDDTGTLSAPRTNRWQANLIGVFRFPFMKGKAGKSPSRSSKTPAAVYPNSGRQIRSNAHVPPQRRRVSLNNHKCNYNHVNCMSQSPMSSFRKYVPNIQFGCYSFKQFTFACDGKWPHDNTAPCKAKESKFAYAVIAAIWDIL